MSDFLPKGYEPPEAPNNYMKFEIGDNVFRPLDSAIIGWEGWKTEADGARKPVRWRKDDQMPQDAIDDPEKVKHFWAFPVYNYKTETIQILEITQRTVQKAISSLTRQKYWGSPVGVDGYDLVVTRSGEGMDTTYAVMPKPHKKLDAAIMQTYRDMNIRLEALFDGEDPFAGEGVDPDDIPDDL